MKRNEFMEPIALKDAILAAAGTDPYESLRAIITCARFCDPDKAVARLSYIMAIARVALDKQAD